MQYLLEKYFYLLVFFYTSNGRKKAPLLGLVGWKEGLQREVLYFFKRTFGVISFPLGEAFVVRY